MSLQFNSIVGLVQKLVQSKKLRAEDVAAVFLNSIQNLDLIEEVHKIKYELYN
jgi:hypothetical protein